MQRHHIDCEDDRVPGIRHFVRQNGLKKGLHYWVRLDDACWRSKLFTTTDRQVFDEFRGKPPIPRATTANLGQTKTFPISHHLIGISWTRDTCPLVSIETLILMQ